LRRLIVNDAQTSGGLLISVPEARQNQMMNALNKKGVIKAVVVGKVTDYKDFRIIVEK